MVGGHTELVLLPHSVNEVTGAQTLVEGLGELLSSTVKGTTETRTNGQKTRNESTDQILAGTGGDDGVHGTGHGRAVISGKHENHLQELASIGGKAAAEPKKRHDTTNANVLPEDIGDGHTGVKELLTTVVGDSGDESSGLTDETELLGPGVVDRNLRGNRLGLRLDVALADLLVVDLLEHAGHVLKGLGNVDTSLPHGLVLSNSGLQVGVGRSTSVTELDLRLEHAGASTNSPGNNGLGDGAVLDGLDDTVLLNTTDFAEQHKDLALRLVLVTQQMVDESGTRVTITTNGNTLVDTIGILRDNVVQFIGHTTGLGDVADRALTVELGSHNVVHHTTSVTNLESTRLDTSNGSGSNNGDALLLGSDENLTSALLPLSVEV